MTVVVAGGGVTGLVAARSLAEAGHDVVLVEATPRLGGKIVTRRAGGALIEGGPDWFVTRVPDAVELCRALGLEDDLVPPATSGTLVARNGELLPFPEGFVRGVPPSARAARASGFLSARGAARVLGDYLLPGPLSGGDVSIASVVRRRFGEQVLERLVEPMVAASRSGAVDEISLAVGAPELDDAARSSRSMMRALRETSRRRTAPPFLGLRGGMERLVDALAADLGDTEVMLGAAVTAVERAGDGWRVRTGSDVIDARAAVVALPAPAAARALRGVAPEAAAILDSFLYEPAAVVGLTYPPGSVPHRGDASGVLVPVRERRTITACAWFSAKWPHVAPPDGPDVVRAFATRSAAAGDEDSLAERVAGDVARLLGAPPVPEAVVVTRWEQALPVPSVGHLGRVAAAERALPRGLAVAGAAYRGSGLPDCIRSGAAAAAAVVGAGR